MFRLSPGLVPNSFGGFMVVGAKANNDAFNNSTPDQVSIPLELVQ